MINNGINPIETDADIEPALAAPVLDELVYDPM